MMNQRIADTRRQLVEKQDHLCARCSQPIIDAFHISRLRSDANESRPHILAATHVSCDAPPDQVMPDPPHANGAMQLNAQRCPRCGANADQQCITASRAFTKPHKARLQAA